MLAFETLLLVVGVLLLCSVWASRASSRLGVPALVLFLVIGMLSGSDGPGGIAFDNPGLAQSLGVTALIFILFAGGLDTDWKLVRPVLGEGLLLANLGVAISACLVGVFAVYVLGFDPLLGLLFGAIVSSTDAAAVFSVVRERGVSLRNSMEPLLEMESGSNDPMAVFLTIGLTHLIVDADASVRELILELVLEMAVGASLGYAAGRTMEFLINRARLQSEGLYPALTLALMLLTYGLTDQVGGNGFLAIYIAGMTLGNQDFVHKRSIMRFHDAAAWLTQIGMFLALGLLVFPSQLMTVVGSGLLASAFLIFVARPASVFGALAFKKRPVADKLMVSWAGLRGAVPIVLATFPLLEGVPQANLIFNLVFFIVLTSVLIQGTTIPWVARWLGVNRVEHEPFQYPAEYVPQVDIESQLAEVFVGGESALRGRSLMEVRLPKGALVILVERNGNRLVPSGATVLEGGDRMLVLADPDELAKVRAMAESPTVASGNIVPS